MTNFIKTEFQERVSIPEILDREAVSDAFSMSFGMSCRVVA
jgi:hypothetical protein